MADVTLQGESSARVEDISFYRQMLSFTGRIQLAVADILLLKVNPFFIADVKPQWWTDDVS